MGNEFIKKVKGSKNTGWDRGRLAMSQDDLFTRHPECATYAASATMRSGSKLSKGERITVELGDRGLVVVREMSIIGDFKNAPEEMVGAVQSAGGVMNGRVEEVYDLSGQVEISLCP